MKYYLKDIAKIKNGKKAILEDVGVKVYGSNGVIGFSKDSNAPRNSIIIGRVGANTGSVFFSDEEHWVTDNAISVVPNNKINPIYLFYLLKQKKLNRLAEGSAQPLVNQKILNSFLIDIPSLEIQNKLADKLYKIDKKLELNNKINTNLEKISTEFFLNWLSNTHSDKKKSLDSIANYKNGLAMQKFRPVNIKESLPVVKIRELNQGHTDSNSDLCRKDIDKSVQINTGDIIFSWSGTLLLDLWAGTEAGLNQHLFKVTSNDYPSWFIYEWTKYYLQEFQLIAESKATTMGHIKRSNLKESFAIIPNDNELTKLNNLLGPIFDNKIKIRKQNLILKQIKNQLLAKLLN